MFHAPALTSPLSSTSEPAKQLLLTCAIGSFFILPLSVAYVISNVHLEPVPCRISLIISPLYTTPSEYLEWIINTCCNGGGVHERKQTVTRLSRRQQSLTGMFPHPTSILRATARRRTIRQISSDAPCHGADLLSICRRRPAAIT